jgi:hypothetical protein
MTKLCAPASNAAVLDNIERVVLFSLPASGSDGKQGRSAEEFR